MLSISEDKSTVLAEVLNHDMVEHYECAFSVCPNPVCTCGVMTIRLTPIRLGEYNDMGLIECDVALDLVKRRLAYKDIKNIPDDVIKFAKLFLGQLNDDDYQLLLEENAAHKHHVTEEAAPESIEADFDFDEVENSSLMYAYNDVLPYAEQLIVDIKDRHCIVFDQYCIKPKCNCTETLLNVFEIADESVHNKELSVAKIDYKKGRWKIFEEGLLPLDIELIKTGLLNRYPDLLKKLKARHTKLRAIYNSNRKRNDALIQKINTSGKIGRNDPCPCGSGKKYKKCCLGKIR